MGNLFDKILGHAAAHAQRLCADNSGNMSAPYAFSLTGLGLAVLGCVLFVQAGFNVNSGYFVDDILRALRFF